jgi:hypothetical protein
VRDGVVGYRNHRLVVGGECMMVLGALWRGSRDGIGREYRVYV